MRTLFLLNKVIIQVTLLPVRILTSIHIQHNFYGNEKQISEKTKCTDPAQGKSYHYGCGYPHILVGDDNRVKVP